MPVLKYQGIYEGGFRSGFVRSPDALQQGNSKLLGLLIDWEEPGDGLALTYKVGFHTNTFLNGMLNPNTLILSGGDDFINAIQVCVKREGFWSFLPGPQLSVSITDPNGIPTVGSNNQALRSENGIVSLSIQFS